MIEIVEAKTHSQMKKFAKFPCDLYSGNPYYVPSLRGDDVNMANPKKNYNAQYCDIKCFLAYKNGEIVGRIAGIIHKKSNEIHHQKQIRISRFDFIDDLEVSGKLLEAVAEFGREHGMTVMSGPWGFNDTDREGMLTDGFDRRATYATNYNFPYYPEHMKKHGFTEESEWSEYKFLIPDVFDEKITKMSDFLKKKFELRDITEEMRLSEFVKKYVDDFFDIYNACYRHLDNYVDVEGEEKKNVLSQFATIINEKYYSLIVDKDNKLVAFGIIIPSIAEALIKSRGRYSIGLIKSIIKPKELECAIIGVAPEYQKRGISIIMINKIMKNVVESGIKDVESNPMLTTNSAIRNQFSHFEHDEIKRRKTFKKAL